MILSGRDINWYVETGKLKIEPVRPDQFQQNGIDLILEDIKGTPENFEKGTFVLGTTREMLSLPDDLMAFVELRSSWARQGILIPPTIVDAGFRGNLTLEIVAFANVRVPYGERFAHLIFGRLTSPNAPYNGKYQNQKGITEAIPDSQRALPHTSGYVQEVKGTHPCQVVMRDYEGVWKPCKREEGHEGGHNLFSNTDHGRDV